MKRSLILPLLVLSCACSAQETYKCRTAAGTVYQDSPCVGVPANTLHVYGAPAQAAPATKSANAAAAPVAVDREKIYLASRAKERKQAEIAAAEQEIGDLQRSMDAELNALREKKAYAKDNLAGATWEQSISTEMQSVTAKYGNEISAKQEKIRRLREDLAKM